MSERPRPRFVELDGLRGVAALLVVLCHLTFGYDSRYVGQPKAFVDLWWGAFGVQLFFMISGFVILMSARRVSHPSDFVIGRISRLYPAYWIALALAVTWSVLFAIPKTQLTWPQRFANLVMVQRWANIPNADEVYWTLAIEMQFYVLILVGLVLTRCRLSDRVVTAAALGWVAIALLVSVIAMPHSHGIGPQFVALEWKLLLNAVLAEWGPLFATGMFAHLARTTPKHWYTAGACGVASVITAGLLNTWSYAGIVALVVALFLLVAARPTTGVLRSRPLQWLGKISYSLYIVHNLLAMWVIHLLVPLVGRTAAMLVALVVVLLVARAVHQIGEVWGSATLKRLLMNLMNRRQPLEAR